MSEQEKNQGVNAVAIIGGLVALGVGIYYIAKAIKNTGKATLTGLVVSGLNGSAIQGAVATVGKVSSSPTGANGKFTIPGLSLGNNNFVVSASGYLDTNEMVNLVAGNNSHTFQMFTTVNQSALKGTVTDINTSDPLSGVTVQLSSGQSATTDSQGQYNIPGLATGNVTVTFTKNLYATETATKLLVVGSNTQNMEMDNMGTLTGYVMLDDSATGIGGITVSCGTYSTTSVSPSGYYSLKLPSGSQSVTANGGTAYTSDTEPVTIIPKQSVGLQLQINPTYSSNGTVTGYCKDTSTNQYITGKTVTLYFANPSGIIYGPYYSDPAYGSYSVALPGSTSGIAYTITAQCNGYLNYTSSQSVRTGAIHNKEIDMTPVTVPAGTVIGYARDAVGEEGIPGIEIHVTGYPSLNTVTDVTGFFQINNIPAGSGSVVYQMEAHDPANVYSDTPLSVTVISGQIVEAYFPMQTQLNVTGFQMLVDWDPTIDSNFLPYVVADWYSDINDAYLNWFISVNSAWYGNWDMSNLASGSLLHVELWDANQTHMAASATVVMPSADSPIIKNGHRYTFTFTTSSTGKLADDGIF